MADNDKPGFEDWRDLAARELGQGTADDLVTETPEGIAVQPLYTARDLEGLENLDSLPGFEPYLRGVRATMYANRPWTVRQYAGFSTAEDSNAFYRDNLKAGQTGLSVAFDLPTHRGYDSDHPRVAGDVGMAGVAIDTVEDMKILFDGIPLETTSVSMTMSGAVLPAMANFIVTGEEQGVAPERLSGTIQNDILKEFLVRNTYIYPPGPSMRIAADVIEYAARAMPRFNSVSISGYHMHEAGATLVQELAYTLADGMEYVRGALARGLEVDDFAPRLSFFFGVGMNFFMEAAKLRAARLLWSRIMGDFGATQARSRMLRTHCQTSGVSLTAQDPYNNIVRTTLEALSAVLGGTQSLHTNAYDEALALPTETSARVARNTQLILANEAGLAGVIDPLGGSYYVESLTRSMADEAWKLIAEVEALGGMTRAIENGLPRRNIEEAAARRQARIEKGEQVIVGVNAHAGGGDEAMDVRTIDNTEVGARQVERLARVRRERDQAAVDSALSALAEGAAGEANLLELSVTAARARATGGEISDALESVFTRHVAANRAVTGVYAEAAAGHQGFEAARAAVAAFAEARKRPPRMLLAKMGQDGHDRGAKVIASAFVDMGFEVVFGPLFQSPAEAATAAIEEGVDLIGVSSLAGAHRALVPELLGELKAQGADGVRVICGGIIPEQDRAALMAAGVAAIFGPGTVIPEAVSDILEILRRDGEA